MFICSLSFKLPNAKAVVVEGKIKGKISYKILGNKGFGYDLNFYSHYKLLSGEMGENQEK